jgi:hypothetical protein
MLVAVAVDRADRVVVDPQAEALEALAVVVAEALQLLVELEVKVLVGATELQILEVVVAVLVPVTTQAVDQVDLA